MKKIISLLLVLALCCAGAGAALAEENAAEEDENTIILCNGGITVTVPESMRNLKGMLQASETGELVPGSGLFGGSIFYLMKTEEEMADLQERYMQIIAEAGDELTEEQQNQINELLSEYSAAYAPLFEFLTVSGGKTLEEGVGSLIGEETLAMYDIRLLGTVGEYSHYLLQLKPDSEAASSTVRRPGLRSLGPGRQPGGPEGSVRAAQGHDGELLGHLLRTVQGGVPRAGRDEQRRAGGKGLRDHRDLHGHQ